MTRLWSALVVAVLLAACSGSGTVQWRGLSFVAPDGWETFEQTATGLGIANAPLDGQGVRGARAVAAQFSYEPRTVADDWRRLVSDEGGTMEVDESMTIDGVPARRLMFSWVTNGIPLREMVVLIPSRSIVILMQPIVEQGETDGPQRFLDNLEAFDALLASIDFSAPVDN